MCSETERDVWPNDLLSCFFLSLWICGNSPLFAEVLHPRDLPPEDNLISETWIHLVGGGVVFSVHILVLAKVDVCSPHISL